MLLQNFVLFVWWLSNTVAFFHAFVVMLGAFYDLETFLLAISIVGPGHIGTVRTTFPFGTMCSLSFGILCFELGGRTSFA